MSRQSSFQTSPSISPEVPVKQGRGADRPVLISLTLMAVVAVWVLVVSWHHTALHHDMAEQFVWAHDWQWGYPKHPPLPTWLFLSALTVLPPEPRTLYALSAVCMGLTGVFTYLAARALLLPKEALGVALLWSLMQPFSWRAWIYNHNTVLVMTVAFSAWASACAGRRQTMMWWALAGFGAGLAMSTKLQAIIPLLGLLWALWRDGSLSRPAAARRLGLSLLMALLVSAPPLLWMLTGHTNALAYATHQLGSGEGEGESVKLAQFFVSELRMMAPMLLLALGWGIWRRRTRKAMSAPSPEAGTRDPAAWVQGLLLLPLLVVLAMGLLGGSKLHAQWGVQTFQFLPLCMVIWLRNTLAPLTVRQMVTLAGALQTVALAVALTPAGEKLHAPGAVEGYPSREFADHVVADWHRLAPNCPLRYVAAPFFEGGQLAAYTGSFPRVLEDGDPHKSPWIDVQDMHARGSVVVVRRVADLPADAIHEPGMQVNPPPSVKGVWPSVWGIRRPQAPCQ